MSALMMPRLAYTEVLPEKQKKSAGPLLDRRSPDSPATVLPSNA
jgi:hypothetical protein